MSITAVIAREPHTDFEVAQVELDQPRADEILVRIHGVGLCHTDLAIRDRRIPLGMPAVLGHEGSGVVEAVGADVTKVKPGDHVVLSFNSCGTCVMCAQHKPVYCRNFGTLNFSGTRADGSHTLHCNGEALHSFYSQSSFAEYSLAYEGNVVKIPDDVPVELMGPVACGIQTGAGAVMRSLACRPGSSIVILGGGSVGMSAAMAAVVQGCTTIIVSEPVAERRALALDLGATHVIDPVNENLTEALHAIIPLGVDYAIDTTARADVILATLDALAPQGTLGLIGVPPSMDTAIPFRLTQLMGTGLSIRGIHTGDSEPDVFIPQLIDLYRQGSFPIDKLMKTYRLEDINKAVHDQHDGKVIKAILVTDAVTR
ncbi:MAG: NAD(P)-dependent alcohol dehydrogenase [Sphingomonadaceae bacterium]